MSQSTYQKIERIVGGPATIGLDFQFLGYSNNGVPIFQSISAAQAVSEDGHYVQKKGTDRNGNDIQGFAPNKW